MLEHLVVAMLGTFALGLATWQIVRVISHGSLFETFRYWLKNAFTSVKEPQSTLLWWWWRGWDCRLCFHTEVAIVLTWGLLSTGLVVDRHVLPAAGWGFVFAVGPFLTAAWAEVIRHIERWEAPE